MLREDTIKFVETVVWDVVGSGDTVQGVLGKIYERLWGTDEHRFAVEEHVDVFHVKRIAEEAIWEKRSRGCRK